MLRKMIERRAADLRALTMAIANGTAIGSPFGGGDKAYEAWQRAQKQPSRPQAPVSAEEAAARWAALKAEAEGIANAVGPKFSDAVRVNAPRKSYTKPNPDPAYAATTIEEFRRLSAGRKPH